MGRLRERQEQLRNHAVQARRRIKERETRSDLPEAAWIGAERDRVRALWHGGPTVVALLFGHPDSAALRLLDRRGDYFDVRTGDTWDLFFPGYFRSPEDQEFEVGVGSHPIGQHFGKNWFFHPHDFEMFRSGLEQRSGHRWEYSGGTDLVLVNAWLVEQGEPVVDWASTICGQITDDVTAANTLTLGEVIERITRDLETQAENASYGVGEVTNGTPQEQSSFAREVTVNALGGIIAALGLKALGG